MYGRASDRHARVIELLRQVGVPEPEMRARQLPGELSGGLRQRALIATAIALDPQLLIADEPTTALDVTIQAQILSLLEESKQRGRALIVISHDLAVVSRLADRVAVMRDGLDRGAGSDRGHSRPAAASVHAVAAGRDSLGALPRHPPVGAR